MKQKLHIEYRPIDSVTPYARNARTHSPQQIKQVANSIDAFGFINPVLIDKNGELVAGHARLFAAKQLGLKVIPVIQVDHLSEAEKRAYILADNKLAENAGWNPDLLQVELEYLTNVDLDFDADLTGFSTTDIDLILGHDTATPTDDEITPPPSVSRTISRPGDIWFLDKNRVIVGDCRNSKTLDQLMGGAKASMVLTDPPYNVNIEGHVSGLGRHKHREFAMASGELTPKEFSGFLRDSLEQLARVSSDGSLHYVFMDWRGLPALNAASLFVYDDALNLCVWAKTNAGMGSLYRSQHELVLIFKKGSVPHRNNVELGRHGRYRTNVWNYAGVNSFGANRDESLAMHPTVKPVQLLADAILDVTRQGEIVLDGFLGSGSTLIAAERTGRVCYGVELDPGYVDVTIDRWEAITGKRAILAGTNLNIDQVATERGVQREVTS